MNGKAAAGLLWLCMHAGVALAHGPAGECSASQPQIEKSRAELERAPQVLSKRFELAALLNAAGCNDEAVHVLEDGEATNPRSSELQARLRTARSLVSERQFFDGLDKAQLDARAARNELRCTRFGDITACDEALRTKPDAVALVVARGDALLKDKQLLEALATFRHAATLAPADTAISAKLLQVETQQREFHQQCMTRDGTQALSACQAVLVKGAPDEFDITRRIATLYQSDNQSAKSLDFYIAANSLRRGDKSVALAIVALTDSTGRSDAVALAARGSALVTLGKPRDAMTVLEQAQALSPGLPDVVNQIAAAERLLKQEVPLRETQKTQVAATVAAAGPKYSNVEPAGESH